MKQFSFIISILFFFSCNEASRDKKTNNINIDEVQEQNIAPIDTITNHDTITKQNILNKEETNKSIECSYHRKHIEGTEVHQQIIDYIYNGNLDSLKILDSIHFKYIDKKFNESYLFFSVKANNIEITQFLIEKGVDINIVGKNIGNALHFATRNTQLASLLIKNGININIQDTEGVTPIMLAAQTGNIDLVQILLDNKADLTLKDNNGQTVVDYSNGTTRIEYNQLYKPIKELLKSYGAISGYRLREAFKYGSVTDVELLLKQKTCKPDEKDQFGSTCLVYSCDVEKLKLLIEYGIDINIKNQDNLTGLMYATKAGCFQAVKFYLENGADVNATCNGKTALDYAKKNDIIELLNSHKNKINN